MGQDQGGGVRAELVVTGTRPGVDVHAAVALPADHRHGLEVASAVPHNTANDPTRRLGAHLTHLARAHQAPGPHQGRPADHVTEDDLHAGQRQDSQGGTPGSVAEARILAVTGRPARFGQLPLDLATARKKDVWRVGRRRAR